MFLPFVIAYIFLFNTYMLSPYASLPALFGFINIYAGINDRLTYDESGIRQYMAFRKVRAIQWDGLENMVYRRFAQRLMLSGGGTTVTIALDNPDAQRFLEFMAERVTGEMRSTVEQIQLAKTDGKQV